MSRLKPTTEVIRGLFARSGNRCAFPDCGHLLISEKNKFVAQICHIEAASPGGHRYNPLQSDEERRSYKNLMILCYAHHVETNDEREWTADKLRAMKRNHERQCDQLAFRIDEKTLREISDEMEVYWSRIHRVNTQDHVAPPDVALQVDPNASFGKLLDSCDNALRGLVYHHNLLRESDEKLRGDFRRLLSTKGVDPAIFDDIPYYDHPFDLRNDETHFMALPNLVQRLEVDLLHMEIKFLEECLKAKSSDKCAKERLDELREQFARIAQTGVLID